MCTTLSIAKRKKSLLRLQSSAHMADCTFSRCQPDQLDLFGSSMYLLLHLEQMHTCFSVSCFGSDGSRLLQDSPMSRVGSVQNISWEVMPAFPRGTDPAFCQELTAGNLLPQALETPTSTMNSQLLLHFASLSQKETAGLFKGILIIFLCF